MNIRTAKIQNAKEIASLEAQCFPSAEAASESSFYERLTFFPKHFWILEEGDRIVACINGMVTDMDSLTDEMYENAAMHNELGAWQMIFGVMTLPEYQGYGYAGILMKYVIDECRKQGRKGLVLTCKDKLVGFYERFGFENKGLSESEHGGVRWNEMRLTF